MHKSKLPVLLIVSLLLVLSAVIIATPTSVFSVANHIVISEIQISSTIANDEFVELYNPTNDTIDLTGWKLKRKTASSSTETNLASSISGSIAPHGFFLLTHPSYAGSVAADMQYTSSASGIAANNTVLLRDSGNTLIDKVGMGVAQDNETASASVPGDGESVERKANSLSTDTSMNIGGTDETAGNGEDTDNNSADFILRAVSQPQNAQSTVEPVPGPTPSPVVSPTPLPTPQATPEPTPEASPSPAATPAASPEVSPSPIVSPTPNPSPSVNPTPSPSPLVSPSPSPFVSPTPAPTVEPSPSPQVSATPLPTVAPTPSASPVASSQPSPSATPSINPSPLVSPTPQPSPSSGPVIIFNGPFLICQINYVTIHTRFFTFQMPHVHCFRA